MVNRQGLPRTGLGDSVHILMLPVPVCMGGTHVIGQVGCRWGCPEWMIGLPGCGLIGRVDE